MAAIVSVSLLITLFGVVDTVRRTTFGELTPQTACINRVLRAPRHYPYGVTRVPVGRGVAVTRGVTLGVGGATVGRGVARRSLERISIWSRNPNRSSCRASIQVSSLPRPSAAVPCTVTCGAKNRTPPTIRTSSTTAPMGQATLRSRRRPGSAWWTRQTRHSGHPVTSRGSKGPEPCHR